MTEAEHDELRVRVNCLLKNVSARSQLFGCAQQFVEMLPHITFGGQFVLHLNEQYIEIVDLLWEDMCRGTYADGDARQMVFPPRISGCVGCGGPRGAVP